VGDAMSTSSLGRRLFPIIVMTSLSLASEPDCPPDGEAHVLGTLDVHQFHSVDGPKSGPQVYYTVVDGGPDEPLLRGNYRPGMESVEMGVEVPDALRHKVRALRWRWRARAFPDQGDECRPGKGDSAASVSVGFKRGLKWYVIKYVWSSVGPKGAVCDQKRNLFLARDTVVLESGGETQVWKEEEVDLRRAFREHFEKGDPHAEVPDPVGLAVMSDGDQTHSASGADFASFELLE
jgi:hypothetical protein